jgi:thiosulfate/3-mercaptopyruvate sulfurtransferase
MEMSSKPFGWSLGIAALFVIAYLIALASPASVQADSDPWTKAQTVQPADLAKELGNSKAAPTVVFVGFKRLYSAGHIKGAEYHGTAGSEEGLKELTAWAAGLSRSTNLVIYCGCCPLDRCPNIRPAFKALQGLGFKNLRVLLLPQDFATDWVGKGLPYDKGN